MTAKPKGRAQRDAASDALWSILEVGYLDLYRHFALDSEVTGEARYDASRDVACLLLGLLASVAGTQRGMPEFGFVAAFADARHRAAYIPAGDYLFRPTWLLEHRKSFINQSLRRQLGNLGKQIGLLKLSSDVIAAWFENTYGRLIESGSVATTTLRKDEGVYFTPRSVTRALTQLTFEHMDCEGLRILDPAMGGGSFLLECLRFLRSRGAESASGSSRRRALATIVRSLYGVDRDRVAVDLGRALLWLEAGDPAISLDEISLRLRVGDSLLGPPPQRRQRRRATVPRWDPYSRVFGRGGFDVVISNPPWSALRASAREFAVQTDERIHSLQGAALTRYLASPSRSAASHEAERRSNRFREYARSLQGSGYIAQGIRLEEKASGGDWDLYKVFMERSVQLLRAGGRIALVVPSGFYRAEGASGIRRLYLSRGTILRLIDVRNGRLFPIHPMFRFTMLVFQEGGRRRGIAKASFDQRGSIVENQDLRALRGVSLSNRFLARVSGASLAVPELRSSRERKLFEKLHERHPTLGNRGRDIRVRFARELDMSLDAELFVDRGQLNGTYQADGSVVTRDGRSFLPLYEGRMVHQYDAAAKEYLGGQARTSRWMPLRIEEKRVRPHYYVSDSRVAWDTQPRAGYCEVTGHANERTVLSALIPARAISGNKVPTCRFESQDPSTHLIWIAIANSFVVDWLIRRRITTTLNYFHWKMIPFPDIRPATMLGRWLALAAECLSLPKISAASRVQKGDINVGAVALADRASTRAEVDAVVAQHYGLSLEEFADLLRDFPLLDRAQPPLRIGESMEPKSTITRDLALLALGRRLGISSIDLRDLPAHEDTVIVTDLERRVRLAKFAGAEGYVPTELAIRRASNASARPRGSLGEALKIESPALPVWLHMTPRTLESSDGAVRSELPVEAISSGNLTTPVTEKTPGRMSD